MSKCAYGIFHMREQPVGHANTKPTALFMRALVTAAIIKNSGTAVHQRATAHVFSICVVRDREVSCDDTSFMLSLG